MTDVVRTIEIKAPPSAVWRWLDSEEALRRWISPSIEIDLRVGGAYRMLGADGTTTITGSVLELVPEERLALSWREEDAGWTNPARLVIELVPSGSSTQVTLVHDGFAGIGLSRWPEIAQAYDRGADRHGVLDRLAELVVAGG